MGDRRFHHRRRKRSWSAVVVSFGMLTVEVRCGRWWCSVRGKGEKGWRREKGGDENEGRERRVDGGGGGCGGDLSEKRGWRKREKREKETVAECICLGYSCQMSKFYVSVRLCMSHECVHISPLKKVLKDEWYVIHAYALSLYAYHVSFHESKRKSMQPFIIIIIKLYKFFLQDQIV